LPHQVMPVVMKLIHFSFYKWNKGWCYLNGNVNYIW
jgi:hypothetical protein